MSSNISGLRVVRRNPLTGELMGTNDEPVTLQDGDVVMEMATFTGEADVQRGRPASVTTVETFEWQNLSDLSHPAVSRASVRASGVLEWVANKVPKRINTEELGDALERIHHFVVEGRSSWAIYRTVARACWAVLWHTLHHGAEQLIGVVKIAMGRGDDRR